MFRNCRLLEEIDLSRTEVSQLSLSGSSVHRIMADGLVVKNDVLLREHFTANGEVRLLGAQIGGDLDCSAGSFVNECGTAISADRVKVTGSVFLNNGFTSCGEVRVAGADIGGELSCVAGSFANKDRNALSADHANIKGSVRLGSGFTADGEVNLVGAKIDNELNCGGGVFSNEKRTALNADGFKVTGDVFLRNGFIAKGKVRLIGAQIGGDLDCEAGTFVNEDDTAIDADRVNVAGDVFFRKGLNDPWKETPFTANGRVNLPGAQIVGQIDCSGGVFNNHNGDSLTAERANVKSSVLLSDGFKADGWVNLLGAQIGGDFRCDGGNFQDATLNLTDTSVATLSDYGLNDPVDPKQAATIWPPGDKDHYLLLDGFTYGRISSKDKINVDKRLGWLARQPQSSFHPQPYLQLAKVLEAMGDSEGRLRVLVEMERLRRKVEDHDWIDRFDSFVYRWSAGYGYRPLWAVGEAVALTALGWIIYRRSYLAGGMVPTDKEACAKFREPGAPIPRYYPSFSPLLYSVENSLPLVKLGQGDKWQPDPEPVHPRENPGPKLRYRGVWQWPAPKTATVGDALDGNKASATLTQPSAVVAQDAPAISDGGGTTSAPTPKTEPPPISRRRFFAPLERVLVAVGLQPSNDVNRTPSFPSRFGTSPRFVT